MGACARAVSSSRITRVNDERKHEEKSIPQGLTANSILGETKGRISKIAYNATRGRNSGDHVRATWNFYCHIRMSGRLNDLVLIVSPCRDYAGPIVSQVDNTVAVALKRCVVEVY